LDLKIVFQEFVLSGNNQMASLSYLSFSFTAQFDHLPDSNVALQTKLCDEHINSLITNVSSK